MVTDNISAGSRIRLGLQAAPQKPLSPFLRPCLCHFVRKWQTQQSPVPDPAQVHSGTQRFHRHAVLCRTQKPPGFPQNINHMKNKPDVWCWETWELWCILLPGNHLFKITGNTQLFVKRILTGKNDRDCQQILLHQLVTVGACRPRHTVPAVLVSYQLEFQSHISDSVIIGMETPDPQQLNCADQKPSCFFWFYSRTLSAVCFVLLVGIFFVVLFCFGSCLSVCLSVLRLAMGSPINSSIDTFFFDSCGNKTQSLTRTRSVKYWGYLMAGIQ